MSRNQFGLRFGLRTLFVLMLLAAAFGLGWKSKQWHDARRAAERESEWTVEVQVGRATMPSSDYLLEVREAGPGSDQ